MADSLSDWLALREPADAAARSSALVDRLLAALPADRPLRIVDLASGTGSNIRYLAPRLPKPQEWLAVDREPALLAHAPAGVRVRAMELGPLDDPAVFSGRHLVTASALLDLVSASWMRRLVTGCGEAGAAVLFALTYDGRSECVPRDPWDDEIRDLFNRHQTQNDKGFGAAAGPDAGDCMAHLLAAAGYSIAVDRSDWHVPPERRALQSGLVHGWAHAAEQIAPNRAGAIRSWLERRLAHVKAGASRIVVGHVDIAGWLV